MIINMNGAKAPETPSPVLQEKTVTPETLPTVIGADEGYDGLSQVTVNPDAQLKAENIRSGKSIFGVNGSFTGETQTVYETVDTVRYALENRETMGGSVRARGSSSGYVVTEKNDTAINYWPTKSSFVGTNHMYKGKYTYIPTAYYRKTSYNANNWCRTWQLTADSFTLNELEVFAYTDNDVNYPAGTSFNITITGHMDGEGNSHALGRFYGYDEMTFTTTGTIGWEISATGYNQIRFTLASPLVINNIDFMFGSTRDTSSSEVYMTFIVSEMTADVIE